MAGKTKRDETTRTRFAPSPTGLLHIGGARTALFNFMWAKRNGGSFLLRFEDTDRSRSSSEYATALRRDLAWLGLCPDEEPVFQASRAERHAQVLEEMVASGVAYPCFCGTQGRESSLPCRCRGLSANERERRINCGEAHCHRLASPLGEGTYTFSDRLHGTIAVPLEGIGDFVLVREDGVPTYLFAVVVDDHDSRISTVIRGEEHISNTPRQEMIYRAMGWEMPQWAHIPMILDAERHKLGKRSGAVSISSYRDEGWEPAALVAYLATLSWAGAPTDRLESVAGLAAIFDLDDVALSSPVHDEQRLRHFGRLALAAKSAEDLLRAVADRFPQAEDRPSLASDREEMIKELLPECATIRELALALDVQFSGAGAGMKPEWSLELREYLAGVAPEEWSYACLKRMMQTFSRERGLKGRDFYHAARRMLTGREEGPPVALSAACLGKEAVLNKMS